MLSLNDHNLFGEGAESRTLACGFGDRRATITLHRHILVPCAGIEPAIFGLQIRCIASNAYKASILI